MKAPKTIVDHVVRIECSPGLVSINNSSVCQSYENGMS